MREVNQILVLTKKIKHEVKLLNVSEKQNQFVVVTLVVTLQIGQDELSIILSLGVILKELE